MKLLFCIKALSNQAGGAERVLVEIVNGLNAKQHDVAVLSYDADLASSFYPLNPDVRWHKLGIGSTNRPATITATLLRMKTLRQKVLSEKPDIVVGFMHSMFIPLGMALLGTGIPVIASEHIVPEHYHSRPLEKYLLYTSPIFIKKLTCVSTQVKELYPSFIRRKMIPISNPVSLENLINTSHDSKKEKIILSVGRLDKQKDHKTLIQAFSLLAQNHPDWTLRIIGEGELRSELENYILSLGLSDRIQLPGNTEKIEQEYNSADLFVMSSRYESFGLALAEALSSGLPAIGFSDCPGVNQLIQSDINGILVDPKRDRASELSNTIARLIQKKDLRQTYSQNALENSKVYSIENVLSQWQTLFLSVLAKE